MQNSKEWSAPFLIGWRKGTIIFLWPLEEQETEITFSPWPAELLRMGESQILVRSMMGIRIYSDSSVIFFSLSKIRSETKPKP